VYLIATVAVYVVEKEIWSSAVLILVDRDVGEGDIYDKGRLRGWKSVEFRGGVLGKDALP
jgi:hypothetical protein